MTVVIKEIQVKITVERTTPDPVVSDERLQKLKRELQRETVNIIKSQHKNRKER
jgi:hypothetical protein